VGISFARTGMVLALAALAVPVGLANANAAANTTLALWNLDEGPAATVMADSSGNGINGVINPAGVQTGVVSGTDTFYRWSLVKPTEPPPKPERVIQINDSRLNPGTRDFAVSFRYRTTKPFGNIMQKGQATTRGGNFKFQLPQGNVTCLVRGSSGQRAVRSLGAYDDNQWHTVRCERTASGITETISDANGVLQETRHLNGATGNISNTFPMTVGGKISCDQVEVTCDYYAGDIDWIKYEVSP
jgi:Laminin G domain